MRATLNTLCGCSGLMDGRTHHPCIHLENPMELKSVSVEIGGRTMTFETGVMAKQADGAVVVRMDDSAVLVTAVTGGPARFDFLPLTVEYQDPTAFVEQLAMPEEQAAGLRSVLQALLDDESLDAFVDDHSEKFKAYSADGEQSLEWGACHMAYVKLVEGILEATLAANGVSIEALYSLLDAQRSSSRGQSFINRFLSLGDYAVFCSMMCTWANLDSVKAQSRYIDDEQAAIDNL